MPQRLTLQINEGMLPRRMHHLEDERMPVCARKMEVVVVFGRQRPRGGLQPVKFARQTNRFRFGHWLSYAGLQQHAPNLICKSRSASIPDGSRFLLRCPQEARSDKEIRCSTCRFPATACLAWHPN